MSVALSRINRLTVDIVNDDQHVENVGQRQKNQFSLLVKVGVALISPHPALEIGVVRSPRKKYFVEKRVVGTNEQDRLAPQSGMLILIATGQQRRYGSEETVPVVSYILSA